LASALIEPDGQMILGHVHDGEIVPRRASNLAFDAVERPDTRTLLEAELAASGVSAQVASIASPTVGGGLHRLAEERNADVIVVGCHSSGDRGRVMLHDNARAALTGAPCAVAVAPHGYAPNPVPIKLIGVGYDGSAESTAAVALARSLAASRGATVRALTVAPLPPWTEVSPTLVDYHQMLDEAVAAARSALEQLYPVEVEAVAGLPSQELATFGDEVDLLVVGSRGYGPPRRLMFGSTARKLTAKAPCPLLVLPRVALERTGLTDDAEVARSPTSVG
jgi:nucleotide-binding universal stress UspA family protein